jgi:hypothetical protein
MRLPPASIRAAAAAAEAGGVRIASATDAPQPQMRLPPASIGYYTTDLKFKACC